MGTMKQTSDEKIRDSISGTLAKVASGTGLAVLDKGLPRRYHNDPEQLAHLLGLLIRHVGTAEIEDTSTLVARFSLPGPLIVDCTFLTGTSPRRKYDVPVVMIA